MDDTIELKKLLPSYLSRLLSQRGENFNPNLPFRCLNPEHKEKTGSMKYDQRRNKVHCFGCGVDWSALDLAMAVNQCDFPTACKVLRQEFGLPDPHANSPYLNEKGPRSAPQASPNREVLEATKVAPIVFSTPTQDGNLERVKAEAKEYIAKCAARIADPVAEKYLATRGISTETAKKFGIGYDDDYRTIEDHKEARWSAIVFPSSTGSYNVRNTNPYAKKNNRYRKCRGFTQGLFNLDALLDENDKRPLIVVEGEIDALSIAECGGRALGLASLSNVGLLCDTVRNMKTNRPEFVLCLDNQDDLAKQKAEELRKSLEEMGEKVRVVWDFCEEAPLDFYKDANEYLTKDRKGLEAFVHCVAEEKEARDKAEQERRREEFQKTSVVGDLRSFVEDLNTARPCFPTGFPSLDKYLHGGLSEGLIIAGARTGLGKTTFILQIADHIARLGTDVLIFALEMSRFELIGKSVSRLMYSLALRKENGNVERASKLARSFADLANFDTFNSMPQESMALFLEALKLYEDKYARHIFIHEGVGNIGVYDIESIVKRHIEQTGNLPIVFVDYLQVIAPWDVHATDKQNTDKAVLELKRMSRDYHIPVFLLSSFNRASTKTDRAEEDSFKESGGIEYTGSVILGLNYENFNADKARLQQNIELHVRKNRFGLRTSDDFPVKLVLSSEFGLFSEVEKH